MAKKRPQYLVNMINETNEYLRLNRVTDEHDSLFGFMCAYLLKRDFYQGFNYFKDEYNTHVKDVVSVFAGSYKKGEYDYLQIM